MEEATMNAYYFSSSTMLEDLEGFHHQDLAIRRFCPARLIEQRASDDDPMELLSSYLDGGGDHHRPHQLEEEELQLVDSFLNTEYYENNNSSNNATDPDNQQGTTAFDHHQIPPQDDVLLPMLVDRRGDDEDDDDQLETTFFGSYEDVPNVDHHAVDEGLNLVHSLLACAEAVGCRDAQLANSLLAQIWPSVSPWGDSLQRVAYCFSVGLKSRLLLLQNVNANGTFNNGITDDSMISTREERLESFRLLHQTTPYIAFGYMAANEAIFNAANGKDLLHIVDVGMEYSFQWRSLVKRLASRTEGPPKLLRITCINEDVDALADLEPSMRSIADESASLGVHLEFQIMAEPVTTSLLTRENLELREGEVLFVNSIMNLHKLVKESRGSLKMILQAIKRLSPTLLTVVEQDANHNGPFFLGRFLESLHYYSAIFDSLEASLPRESIVRIKIENLHFAQAICNIVACEGTDRIERHERADQWRRQIGRAGFQVAAMKCMNQVRTMLSGYGSDGYTVTCEKGCLLLGWKGRSIMLASAWQVHNGTSS